MKLHDSTGLNPKRAPTFAAGKGVDFGEVREEPGAQPVLIRATPASGNELRWLGTTRARPGAGV